jgi:hypothetical protein
MTEQQIVNLLQVDLTRFPELSPDERVRALEAGQPVFGYRYNGSDPHRANRVAVPVGSGQVVVNGLSTTVDARLIWRNNITVREIKRPPNETSYRWVRIPIGNTPPYLGM